MEQRGDKAKNEFFAGGGIRSKGGRTDVRGGGADADAGAGVLVGDQGLLVRGIYFV